MSCGRPVGKHFASLLIQFVYLKIDAGNLPFSDWYA